MSRVQRLLSVSLLLACAYLPLSAQETGGETTGLTSTGVARSRTRPVHGSIMLRGGEMPAVRITINSPSRAYNTVIFSDGTGSFVIPSLPIGNYNVLLEAPGYLTRQEELDVPPGAGPVSVQYTMVAEAVANSGGSTDGFISVASLKVSGEARREYELGLKEARRQKWAEARKHFEAALEKQAAFPAALHALARLDVLENKLERAVERLEEAVRMDASFDPAQFLLSYVCNQMGRHQQALEAATKTIQLRPTFWPPHYELGYAALALGKLELAMESSARIVMLGGAKIPEANLLRAGVMLQRGQLGDARTEMQLFLERAPNHRRAPMVRMILADVEGKLAQASAPR
jgi:tetratricopeptide (TPR) repeat protein